MAKDRIFREGMQVPQDIDGASAPPKGFEHYADASGKDPVEFAKTVINANYPSVTGIQLFRKAGEGIGGDMKIHFFLNGKSRELSVSNQRVMNTLTPQGFSSLAPHLQRMTPFERGVFNTILQEMRKMKIAEIQSETHLALADLMNDIESA